MEGWKLNEGDISFKVLDNLDVMSIVYKALSSNVARTTSYKFCFFKSILDNLFNADEINLSISLHTIFSTFASTYYNLIVHWDLLQKSSKNNTYSSVRKVIDNFRITYPELNGTFIPFESLKPSIQIELIRKIESECRKYVIGAFYGDTQGQLYNFSKKENKIWFNPTVYRILIKQKKIFEKINYFEWMNFLEKCNPEDKLYSLSSKIEQSTKRNNLNQYRTFLINSGQHKCAYCGKELSRLENKTPVDHIIPWSFVKDDKLWNLTLSCPSCNSKKSNKLPIKTYIKLAEKRNNIFRDKYANVNLVKNDFKHYSENRYESMYECALFNGLDRDWHCENYSDSALLESWIKMV